MREGWRKATIAEVCDVVNGGTPKTGVAANWGEPHMWITPAEMGGRSDPYVGKTDRQLTNVGLAAANLLPPYSVILSSRAPIGHLVINSVPMATNQGCKGLIPKRGLDHKYLFYYLESVVDLLNDLGTGTTFKELSGGKLKEVPIPLPPLAEQQRIVAILDKAFAGLTTATSNAAKNLKNARELFDSYLNSILEHKGLGWIDRRLSDLIDVTHGFAFDGKYFVNDEGDYPILLTPGNFTEVGSLNFNERNTKRFTGAVSPHFVLQSGDLVVVMTDLSSKMKILGKPAFVEHDRILHNQRIGRVVFRDKNLWSRYLYYFFRTAVFVKDVKATATGTMVRHTAPKRILNAIISIPPTVDEQKSIAAALDNLSGEVEKLEARYRKKMRDLTILKQAILQRAFSGKLTSPPQQRISEAAE